MPRGRYLVEMRGVVVGRGWLFQGESGEVRHDARQEAAADTKIRHGPCDRSERGRMMAMMEPEERRTEVG